MGKKLPPNPSAEQIPDDRGVVVPTITQAAWTGIAAKRIVPSVAGEF